MDSAKVNDWLQVVGLFGVVASLFFVGLQMKQDHEIALADSYQARAAAVAQHLDSRAANVEALSAELKALGINPDDPVRSRLIDVPESAGTLTELEFRAGAFSARSIWRQ